MMEAICDPNMYIWYFNFGHPGSLNDINILDKSTIVGSILNQTFNTTVEEYTINGNVRDWLYFLVDGIYPPWSVFVKSVSIPVNVEEKKYAMRHEHVRKDIERAFGNLISKFGILERLLRGWYIDDLQKMVECCIIMHNMVIENRRGNFRFNDLNTDIDAEAMEEDMDAEHFTIFPNNVQNGEEMDDLQERLAARVCHMSNSVEDLEKHAQLQNDLIANINLNH